ncbi:unnamed protein product, partial [marine sediment metagenome]
MTSGSVAALTPTLRRIKVRPSKLILDPNNPRFLTKSDDRIDELHFLEPGIIEGTFQKMADEAYRIRELEGSIRKNGWEPVDQIFVRKHRDSNCYVVLEGNR